MSEEGAPTRRGRLRVYLGAAPGVGKTYAALEEAHDLQTRGHDVVVGFVESHGRRDTAAKVGDLEVVPRQTMTYRGGQFEEMDVAAVLARAPQTALVDELAHTNVPDLRNTKRWEDVEDLLAAGINVISTMNIQHLESLNDVVAEITGVRQRETIPDEVVRRADELELVDLTQEGIRGRLAAGKIYPADRIDAALANFFRPGNLGALRELALSWTADRVDEAVGRYRSLHSIDEPWETRERIVVGITGGPGGGTVIRRAARIAMRARGELLGVHVRGLSGLRSDAPELATQQALLTELGGTYLEVSGERLGEALVEVARSHNATQLVIGATRRYRWQELTQGSVVREVLRTAGSLDIHVVSNPAARTGGIPRLRPGALPLRRTLAGWGLVAGLVPLATALLLDNRQTIGLDDVLLVYLLLAVAAAWVGGTWPALTASIAGFLLANRFFTPPLDTWRIQRGSDLFALGVFVVLGVGSGLLVSTVARRAGEAAAAQAEASTLIDLVETSGEESLDDAADRVRQAIGAEGAAVFISDNPLWRQIATAGAHPPNDAFGADRVESEGSIVLALNGGLSTPTEERIIHVYLIQLRNRLATDRLEAEAAEVDALTRADDLRTALLRAISHDLRSPLAAIKAAATSLQADDVEWSLGNRAEFVETIATETLRMERIVTNLLDAGRLQSGGITVALRPAALEDSVAAGVTALGADLERIDIDIAETLPLVTTDPPLLERIIENLVRNAVTFSPSGRRISVTAGRVNDHVDLRVIDHGPGIAPAERDRVFQPFQRLGDTSRPGIGLGLAVAKGFADALGHDLHIDDTPGGGATLVVRMSVAA